MSNSRSLGNFGLSVAVLGGIVSCGPALPGLGGGPHSGAALVDAASGRGLMGQLAAAARPGSRNPAPAGSISHIESVRESLGMPVAPQKFRLILRDDNAVVSFDCDWGHPHWVSWTVSLSDLGNVGRSSNFHAEGRLPSGCRSPQPEDYRGSGYDRGHMTPSGDRTSSRERNDAVFSMANIVPQAPAVNQRAWNDLEMLTRERVREGYEAIVYAGTEGSLGRMAARSINIPGATWKVVLLIRSDRALAQPAGMSEVAPVAAVAAAYFDNSLSATDAPLSAGRTTIDEIEARTGIDLLSGLSKELQDRIESGKLPGL